MGVLLLAPSPISQPHETPLHLSSVPLKGKPAARDTRAPPELSIDGWFFPLPSPVSFVGSVVPLVGPLALVAAQASRATIREDATSMIVGAPPLETGQQLWGLLSRCPGTACERCHAMTDAQIDPLDKRGVQPT